jgi:S-adenosylmethionine decarboxylase
MKNYSNAGQLVWADIWVGNWPHWNAINDAAWEALEASNMTVLDEAIHQFEPQGTTAVWILAESHMAIHTYPEENFIALDIFTCGEEGNPEHAAAVFANALPLKHMTIETTTRGGPMPMVG